MSIINLIRKGLWAILIVLFILLATDSYYTRHFLSHSLPANAMVMSVGDTAVMSDSVVRITTEYQTVLDVMVKTVKPVQPGQTLPVLYNRLIPAQLKVSYLYEIWFKSLLYLLLIVLVATSIFLFRTCCNWKSNKLKKLRREGNHIYTQFESVEAVVKVLKDGKHPYQIVSTWVDHKSKKKHTFKSQYLWKNPIDYIMDQTITVMIDDKNKKKYLMDLSFLPDNIK